MTKELMEQMKEYVENLITCADELEPDPKVRMNLRRYKDSILSRNLKVCEALGCDNMFDFIERSLNLGMCTVSLCTVELLKCKTREEATSLLRSANTKYLGVVFTAEEDAASDVISIPMQRLNALSQEHLQKLFSE